MTFIEYENPFDIWMMGFHRGAPQSIHVNFTDPDGICPPGAKYYYQDPDSDKTIIFQSLRRSESRNQGLHWNLIDNNPPLGLIFKYKVSKLFKNMREDVPDKELP